MNKMALGNQRGPRNEGPLTGRGMGYCGGYDKPGYQNPRTKRPADGRGGGSGNRPLYRYPDCYRGITQVSTQSNPDSAPSRLENIALGDRSAGRLESTVKGVKLPVSGTNGNGTKSKYGARLYHPKRISTPRKKAA